MDAAERLALTEFCTELAALRSESRLQPETQAMLARLETEARARRPILALLSEFLGAPPEHLVFRWTKFPAASGGQADEERFGCPDSVCDRVCGTQPAGPVPRCLLTGEPMRRLGG